MYPGEEKGRRGREEADEGTPADAVFTRFVHRVMRRLRPAFLFN
jgi:hypothetical protein